MVGVLSSLGMYRADRQPFLSWFLTWFQCRVLKWGLVHLTLLVCHFSTALDTCTRVSCVF